MSVESRGETGQTGEELARRYLSDRGYRILETNHRTKLGEIDIIAQDAGTIVFCEVKTRRGNRFGRPFEAVNARKQARLQRLGEEYAARLLRRYPREAVHRAPHFRFDVLSIRLKDGEPEIEHIQNAF